MSDLTPRQTEILRLIQRAIAETGMPPTLKWTSRLFPAAALIASSPAGRAVRATVSSAGICASTLQPGPVTFSR